MIIEKYLTYLNGIGRTKATQTSACYIIKDLQDYLKCELPQVSSQQIQSYLDKKKITNSTRSSYYYYLSTFFRWMHREGFFLLNPMEKVNVPKRAKLIPTRIMTPGETQKLLEALPYDLSDPISYTNRMMLEISYSCSLRCSEVVALNIEDYNPEAGSITVRKSKNKRGRVLPIGNFVDDMLRNYLADIRAKSEKSDPMFCNQHGKRFFKSHLGKLTLKLRRKLKLRTKATHHSFRKSSATHMLRNGASLSSVQALLGHQTIIATQAYTKVYPKDIVKMQRAHHPREKQKNIALPKLEMPKSLYK